MTTTTVTPADLAHQLKNLTAKLHSALNAENLTPEDRIAVLPDLQEAGEHFAGVLRAVGCGTYENAVGTQARALWEPVSDAADAAADLIIKGAQAIDDVREMAEDALLAHKAMA